VISIDTGASVGSQRDERIDTGTGFTSMTLTMLKMAVLAPIPSASDSAATMVKAGLFAKKITGSGLGTWIS